MVKKSMAFLIMVTLIVVLAACGKSEDKAANTGKSDESTNAGKTETEQSAEKPELRMLVPFDTFDLNTDIVGQYLKEKTGYSVKYEQLPAENPDEKLNMLMSLNEEYDIMKMSASQFYKLATAGALEPLDDLIAQYGKTIKDAITAQSWAGTTIDGKIYAIPETGEGAFAGFELAVRQDWMDELGLQMPTTRDELYNVLKTIKEKKKVIPLVGYEGTFTAIASTFGVTGGWQDINGTLVHPVENPVTKVYLEFMSKLYKEGLIDSEWPINASGVKAMEKFTSGKAAMYNMGWWEAPGVTDALAKNFPDAKIGLVPYLKGDDGKAHVGIAGGIQSYVGIPKSATHKEDAMKYMDLKLTPEIFKGFTIGEEGVHHEVKDGKYFPIQPKFGDERSNASSFLTGVDEKNYPTYWQARVRKNPIIQSYFEQMQQNSQGLTVLDPLSYAPPIDAISKNLQKLAKFQDDNFLMFIAGQSMDKYDAFVAQWKADGGDEMVKGANDWYQANKK